MANGNGTKRIWWTAAGVIIAAMALVGNYIFKPFEVIGHVRNTQIHETGDQKSARIDTRLAETLKPIQDDLSEIKTLIKDLDVKIDEHLTDPKVHLPALNRLDERIKSLERNK